MNGYALKQFDDPRVKLYEHQCIKLCGHKMDMFRNKFGHFTSGAQCFQGKV